MDGLRQLASRGHAVDTWPCQRPTCPMCTAVHERLHRGVTVVVLTDRLCKQVVKQHIDHCVRDGSVFPQRWCIHDAEQTSLPQFALCGIVHLIRVGDGVAHDRTRVCDGRTHQLGAVQCSCSECSVRVAAVGSDVAMLHTHGRPACRLACLPAILLALLIT